MLDEAGLTSEHADGRDDNGRGDATILHVRQVNEQFSARPSLADYGAVLRSLTFLLAWEPRGPLAAAVFTLPVDAA